MPLANPYQTSGFKLQDSENQPSERRSETGYGIPMHVFFGATVLYHAPISAFASSELSALGPFRI